MTQPVVPGAPPPMLAREPVTPNVTNAAAPTSSAPSQPTTPAAPVEGTALPDADSTTLTNAFRAGQISFTPGQRVGVRGPDGHILTIPAEETSKAVDAGGELVSEKTLQQALIESKYGGAKGAAGAFAAGAGSALTFGLSDAALAGIGGKEMQERLRAYEELHPIAHGTGVAAGLILPSLVTGGGAGAIEGAGLLARGVRGAGTLVEGTNALARGAGGLAIRGAEALGAAREGGLLARSIRAGAGAAAEGAVMGAAGGLGEGISHEALSEEALGPPDAVAARIFASTAHGALLGGALGGALGVGGEVASSALKSVAVHAHPALTRIEEESAFKTLNARKAFTSRAEEIEGGTRGIGRALKDNGLIELGDTVETIAPKVAKARATAGEAIGEHVAKVTANETVPLRSVLENLETRAQEFDRKLGYEAAANAVRKQKEALANVFLPANQAIPEGASAAVARATRESAEGMRVPLQDLLRARRELEGTINWQTEAVAGQGMKAAGRAIEDFVTEAGDKLAAAKGMKGWADEYKALKLNYRRMALADEAVQDSVERMTANAGHSLTDKIHMAHGMQTAALGLMSGHPMALGALATGYASKMVRTKGSSTLSVLAGKAAQMGRIQEMMASVDGNINKGVKAYLSGKPPKDGFSGTRVAGKDINVAEWQKAIAAYKANPTAATERAVKVLGGVEEHAPNVAKEYAATMRRAYSFLASRMPEPAQTYAAPQFANLQAMRPVSENENMTRRLNPSDEAKAKRYIRAVTNPESVLEDFARGRLSKESVEAIQAVSPTLYNDMRAKVENGLAVHPERLTYQQRIGLGIMFDLAPDWSMTPEGVKTLQDAIKINNAEEAAKANGQGAEGGTGMNGGGTGGPGAAGQTAARNSMSGAERLETRRQ